MAEYIFKSFNEQEDIIKGKSKLKTFPIWSDLPSDVDENPESILGEMFTSSLETGSWEANYYYNIYNQSTTTNLNAEPQFSIAFGTTQSIQLQGVEDEYKYAYPSRAVYSQFLNTLEEVSIRDTYFQKAGIHADVSMSVIYVISVARSRIKDRIELNTWQLNLSGSGAISGSILNLINASNYTTGQKSVPIIVGRLDDYTGPTGSSATGSEFGKFYPQHGIFILDAQKIHLFIGSSSAGFNPTTVANSGSYDPKQPLNNFWEMLKPAGGTSDYYSYFRARTTENVQSTHYFCRIKNYEFNYSTNPTWVSGSNNDIVDDFYTEPRTFITTVGLYDGAGDSGEMVAVAKISRPIPKDTESEALIKVRLDF